MSQQEFNIYLQIFQNYIRDVKIPNYFVYLKATTPVLLERIKKRGRDYELTISAAYLDLISKHYDIFTKEIRQHLPGCELIEIDTNKMNPIEVESALLKQLNL